MGKTRYGDKISVRKSRREEIILEYGHRCNNIKTDDTHTGRFTMFSVITNIYNKKTKEPTLLELFTATRKIKKFFLTTRDVRSVYHG
jgi:hypothetical protein